MDEWSETVSQKSKNHKHPFNFTFCTPEVVHLLSIDTTEHSGPGSFPLHTSTRSHKKDVISLCFLKNYRLKIVESFARGQTAVPRPTSRPVEEPSWHGACLLQREASTGKRKAGEEDSFC